ncbi:hypothetical protein ROLI_038440 [Roseobacter fucihabitans]|uniref:DUF3320 domain-containing protein n=2 Tax=Roseobacter fucihabitans TaxID=1537242 RepID=A0ABZ2BXE4_9RHOB|nr:hypothetical protein [Roseobacter litoralis]
MHVFASLGAHDIDLNRTRARGVADFKAFLDYAERGTIALPARDTGSLGPAENPFEEAIAVSLAAKGWEVRTQIGVSGFRIDLAVVHPDHAGIYLSGVECDGATYHSSATARDRDKVRQAVLEGLGWNILRIWSTDWFRNPADVIKRTHASLEELLQADHEIRAAAKAAKEDAQSQKLEEPRLALPPPADESDAVEKRGVSSEIDAAGLQNLEPDSTTGATSIAPVESANDLFSERFATNVEEAHETQSPALQGTKLSPNPEAFFEASYLPRLQESVAATVRDQGPLPIASLARRVAQIHGWQRTGHRISSRVEKAIGEAETHEDLGTKFIWTSGTYARRIPSRELFDRSIREVHPAEIASMIDAHASDLTAAEDPILNLARLLGIARLSRDAREYLEACIDWCDQ